MNNNQNINIIGDLVQEIPNLMDVPGKYIPIVCIDKTSQGKQIGRIIVRNARVINSPFVLEMLVDKDVKNANQIILLMTNEIFKKFGSFTISNTVGLNDKVRDTLINKLHCPVNTDGIVYTKFAYQSIEKIQSEFFKVRKIKKQQQQARDKKGRGKSLPQYFQRRTYE